jgi:hypothetical protein
LKDGLLDRALLANSLVDQRRISHAFGPITVFVEDGIGYEEMITAMDVARGAGFAAMEVRDIAP